MKAAQKTMYACKEQAESTGSIARPSGKNVLRKSKKQVLTPLQHDVSLNQGSIESLTSHAKRMKECYDKMGPPKNMRR